MIYITTPYSQKPLGDRCCYWIYSYQMHLISKQKINIINFKDLDFFKRIYNTSEVDYFGGSLSHIIPYSTTEAEEFWKDYKDHPKATNIQPVDIDLPEKYIVCQWDAQQSYRLIDEDRKQKIIDFYRQFGYEFIIIGGEARDSRLRLDLDTIAYVISKADYYVGADSGMMNLSKLILPLDKIHSYVNLKWESPKGDNKHDCKNAKDGRSFSGCIRSIYAMGAPINYCENLDNPIIY